MANKAYRHYFLLTILWHIKQWNIEGHYITKTVDSKCGTVTYHCPDTTAFVTRVALDRDNILKDLTKLYACGIIIDKQVGRNWFKITLHDPTL